VDLIKRGEGTDEFRAALLDFNLFNVFNADQINAHCGYGQANNNVEQIEEEEFSLYWHNIAKSHSSHCYEGKIEAIKQGPIFPTGQKNSTENFLI
jgi:hypothetical protein